MKIAKHLSVLTLLLVALSLGFTDLTAKAYSGIVYSKNIDGFWLTCPARDYKLNLLYVSFIEGPAKKRKYSNRNSQLWPHGRLR